MTSTASTTTSHIVLSSGVETGDPGLCVAYITAANPDADFFDSNVWMSDPRRFNLDDNGDLPGGWENDMADLIATAEAQLPDVDWEDASDFAGWGNIAVRRGVRR